MRTLWTVAGFDPSSGAGVTADLLTFAAHGAFGCSAITALTVQNTRGVFGSEPLSPEHLRATLGRLQEDLPPVGVKIGMLGSPKIAQVVGEAMRALQADAQNVVVVLDPVLRSSSGRELFPTSGLRVLEEEVLQRVDWITPNRAELAVLASREVSDPQSVEAAARRLMERFPRLRLVVTGGDEPEPVDVLIMPGERSVPFRGKHVETSSTHGTGCAFSSALLCELTGGAEPQEAVRRAKAFVEGALRHAPGIGAGRGPMDLLWPLRGTHSDTKDLVPLESE